MNIPLSPYVPDNLVSRDGFSRPVPRQPAHLHTQAESGAYLRNSSRVPRRRPFMKPPYAIRPVPSLSGYVIAYRWRSLPRVRRLRASKPQGSSERVLPWQVTMDQLICASLSHTHYWYEADMLKVICLGCKYKASTWYLNGFPDGNNLGGQHYNVGDKPTVILCTLILIAMQSRITKQKTLTGWAGQETNICITIHNKLNPSLQLANQCTDAAPAQCPIAVGSAFEP